MSVQEARGAQAIPMAPEGRNRKQGPGWGLASGPGLIEFFKAPQFEARGGLSVTPSVTVAPSPGSAIKVLAPPQTHAYVDTVLEAEFKIPHFENATAGLSVTSSCPPGQDDSAADKNDAISDRGLASPMVFAAPNPSPSHDSKDFDKCMNKLEEEIAEVAKKNQKQCEEQARAQNEFDATSPKAKFAAQLAEAVHSNAVDARSAVGQRFKRSLTPQEQHAYTQLSDDAARAEFRVKWASRSLETLKVTKTHLQSFQRVDERAVRDVRKKSHCEFGFAATPNAAIAGARNIVLRVPVTAGGSSWIRRRAESCNFGSCSRRQWPRAVGGGGGACAPALVGVAADECLPQWAEANCPSKALDAAAQASPRRTVEQRAESKGEDPVRHRLRECRKS